MSLIFSFILTISLASCSSSDFLLSQLEHTLSSLASLGPLSSSELIRLLSSLSHLDIPCHSFCPQPHTNASQSSQTRAINRSKHEINGSVIQQFGTNVSGTAQQEVTRQALMALYTDTHGENWKYAQFWGTNVSYCQWQGIQCDVSKNINSLSLQDNNLRGVLPPEIGNLTTLAQLTIAHNYLTGALPREIGRLKRLEILDVSFNHMSGELPEELKYAPLIFLHVGYNHWQSTVPKWLGQVSSLQFLFLPSSSFWGPIPKELADNPTLTLLDLSGNNLEGPIPPELGSLPSFTTMDFSRNRLTGTIPQELFNLTVLKFL